MRNYSSRAKTIEFKLGIAQVKSYIFVHYGYRTLENCFRRGKICFKKGEYKGIVLIIDRGHSTVKMDPKSPEAIELLQNNGYELIMLGSDPSVSCFSL